jgi:Uma2 family endonuclease
VLVSCDPADQAAEMFVAHPTLIAEVLSESTAAYDRGDKFAAYRTLPSLQEYVLVDIPARRVETFRRAEGGDWMFHEYLSDCVDCLFPALGISVPFEEIFENVLAGASSARGERPRDGA